MQEDIDDSCRGAVAKIMNARMAELADALDSGSSDRKVVQVQLLFRAHEWCSIISYV